MKIRLFIPLIAFAILFVSCGPATEVIRNNDDRGHFSNSVKVETQGTTLDQYLKRLNGIRVVGEGRSAVVQLRGVTSFELSTQPLFILDGVRVGTNFSSLYDLVNISDVTSIEVLSSSRATLLYGGDGFSGAIIINLKES